MGIVTVASRGDIFDINLGVVRGTHIQSGKQPCVIISNDISNNNQSKFSDESGIFNVCTITHTIRDTIPSHVRIQIDDKPSDIEVEQVFTVAKKDLLKYRGRLSDNDMEKLDEAIATQFLQLSNNRQAQISLMETILNMVNQTENTVSTDISSIKEKVLGLERTTNIVKDLELNIKAIEGRTQKLREQLEERQANSRKELENVAKESRKMSGESMRLNISDKEMCSTSKQKAGRKSKWDIEAKKKFLYEYEYALNNNKDELEEIASRYNIKQKSLAQKAYLIRKELRESE